LSITHAASSEQRSSLVEQGARAGSLSSSSNHVGTKQMSSRAGKSSSHAVSSEQRSGLVKQGAQVEAVDARIPS
jgi:hypothetical protein